MTSTAGAAGGQSRSGRHGNSLGKALTNQYRRRARELHWSLRPSPGERRPAPDPVSRECRKTSLVILDLRRRYLLVPPEDALLGDGLLGATRAQRAAQFRSAFTRGDPGKQRGTPAGSGAAGAMAHRGGGTRNGDGRPAAHCDQAEGPSPRTLVLLPFGPFSRSSPRRDNHTATGPPGARAAASRGAAAGTRSPGPTPFMTDKGPLSGRRRPGNNFRGATRTPFGLGEGNEWAKIAGPAGARAWGRKWLAPLSARMQRVDTTGGVETVTHRE